MSTAVDMAGGITGMVAKPVEEYAEGKRRQARAEELQKFVDKRQEALRNNSADKASIRTGQSGQSTTSAKKQSSIGGKAAAAGAMSVGSIGPRALKGMMVDFPLALTEGLSSVPSHYGGKRRDNGNVTDIGSGFAVAGKTFAWGFADGLSGLVTEPYKDAKKSGAKGIATGLGKGAVGLVTKSGAGMFGLLAYPASGIAKSLRTATHTRSRKAVEAARRIEGDWILHRVSLLGEVQTESVTEAFDRLI
jgi:hypothetical protein